MSEEDWNLRWERFSVLMWLLSDLVNQFLTKEEFFSEKVTGRLVLADIEVAGEIEGKSYLAMSAKDAIHLGGTTHYASSQ